MKLQNSYALHAAIIVLLIATACTGPIERNEVMRTNEPITIGFMTALSGDAAAWGQPILEGAQLAVEEINAKGGIDGRPIVLDVQDDKCDAATAVAAHHYFAQKGILTITGHACSSALLAIAPVAEKAHILVVGTGATSPEITHAGEYIFRLWVSDAYEGAQTAIYAHDSGIEEMGTLTINNEYGNGLKEAFTTSFAMQGGKVKSSEVFHPNEHDFRTQILKLKESGAQAVYIASNPGEAPEIFKQLHTLAPQLHIFVNGPAIEATGVLEASGNAANNISYVHFVSEMSDEFTSAFIARFGKTPSFTAPMGYDSIMVLAKAFEKCGSRDTACMRDILYAIKDEPGASGNITIDSNGDRIGGTFERKIVHIDEGFAAQAS